jgi:hypothetical protein
MCVQVFDMGNSIKTWPVNRQRGIPQPSRLIDDGLRAWRGVRLSLSGSLVHSDESCAQMDCTHLQLACPLGRITRSSPIDISTWSWARRPSNWPVSQLLRATKHDGRQRRCSLRRDCRTQCSCCTLPVTSGQKLFFLSFLLRFSWLHMPDTAGIQRLATPRVRGGSSLCGLAALSLHGDELRGTSLQPLDIGLKILSSLIILLFSP